MHHRSSLSRGLMTAVLVLAVGAPIGLISSPARSASRVIDGPDVASYQHPNPTHDHPYGQPIHWGAVRKAGKEFAIVKATEGLTYTNPNFAGAHFQDYDDAAAAGLVRGAYHFARPGFPIVASAQAQAKYFANVVGRVTTKATLPPALDLEVNGGLKPAQLVTWAQAFLLQMRKLTGRTPMLYTYPNFWTTSLADPTAFARYPLWMAEYGVSRAPVSDLWQFTSTAHVKGIVGDVDMSKYIGTSTAVPWKTLSNGTIRTPWKPAAPGKPLQVAASIDGTTATVTWMPGDAGTQRVTKYVVTPDSGGDPVTVNGHTFAAEFPDLTVGTPYTFTVAAVNSVGTGKASKPTNAVTPTVPTELKAAVSGSANFGTPLPVRAKLRRADTKAALAGKPVLIFRRHSADGKWQRIEKLSTNAKGKVHTVLHPKSSAQLQAVFPGATGVARAEVVKQYTVRPNVGAKLSAPAVRRGRSVLLTGAVSPFIAGQQVARQRKIDGKWRTRGTTTVDKQGHYTFLLTPNYVGDYVFRVVAAATTKRGPGLSPKLHLTVT